MRPDLRRAVTAPALLATAAVLAMTVFLAPGAAAVPSPARPAPPVFTHPLGWGMIAASIILMTIGSLWMRKIIDLKF